MHNPEIYLSISMMRRIQHEGVPLFNHSFFI
jgi:hypothetical protein